MHPICDYCHCRLEWIEGSGYALHNPHRGDYEEAPQPTKQPDLELECLLLEEELIEKRNTLIRLQGEIAKDEEILRAMRVVNGYLKNRPK